MPSKEYSYLKMACAKLGISEEEFILVAIYEKLDALEDEWLAAKAKKILEGGENNTIPWTEAKKD